jgi:molecular chaperone DnaK (HSP70)
MKLGIDFGTCYSSAAVLLDNIPTPINAPLTPGYSFPSSIFITEHGEILVGQAAENNRQKKPQS